MPIYEFKCINTECTECGKVISKLLKFGVIPKCEKCDEEMDKQVSKAGFSVENGASPNRYN